MPEFPLDTKQRALRSVDLVIYDSELEFGGYCEEERRHRTTAHTIDQMTD